jgi:hypothetical protein
MEASSSWTQSGDTTLEIVPEVDRTTATTAATAGNGDDVDDELEVVTGHPGLWAPRHVSLSEAMSIAHFVLCQAQDVLQRERSNIEEELDQQRAAIDLLDANAKKLMAGDKELYVAAEACGETNIKA